MSFMKILQKRKKEVCQVKTMLLKFTTLLNQFLCQICHLKNNIIRIFYKKISWMLNLRNGLTKLLWSNKKHKIAFFPSFPLFLAV